MTSFGVNDGTQQTYFIPWFGANTALGAINSTGPGAGLTPLAGASSTVGNWILSRTAAGGWVTYLNGVVSFTVASDASIGLPSLTLPALAFNTSGTISNWSTDLHAYWFFGGGLTSTQAGQVNVRLHTMLVALGFFVC
jgi:hypothetical protein